MMCDVSSISSVADKLNVGLKEEKKNKRRFFGEATST